MKLQYIRLCDGMQTEYGRLRRDLQSPQFTLTLIGNIRSVKVEHEDWKGGFVYIPCERLECFSPAPEALVTKKG